MLRLETRSTPSGGGGFYASRVKLLAVIVATAVSGCATSSLNMAPEAPDVPFKPNVVSVQDGRLVATKAPTTTTSGARDFSLPPVADLPLPEAPTPIENGHVYGLAELIDLAQTTNPETRTAWEQARQAALRVGITKALYLPIITATVVGGRQHSSASDSVGGLPTTNPSTDVQGTVSGVALQWLLFDFGQRDALTRAAGYLSLASDVAFNGTHQRIIYDVSRAFYEYTAARQKVGIDRKSKAESTQLLQAADARYKQGIGTSLETAQGKQLLAQADFNLVEAEGAERDAYHSLLAAIGLGPMVRMQVQDVSNRLLSPSAMEPVDHVIEQAIAVRPDIQAGYDAAKAAHEGIAAAEADFLPKVFVSASSTYVNGGLNVTSLPALSSLTQGGSSGATSTSTNATNETILGGVSIPIYDGGIRSARLAEAHSRTDAAQATVERLQLAAATEIVAADDAVRTSLAAYRAAGVLVEASRLTEDAAFAAYKSGNGTLTTAIDAERALLGARLAQAQAHGVALIAASTLAFATGRLSSADALERRRLPLVEGPLK